MTKKIISILLAAFMLLPIFAAAEEAPAEPEQEELVLGVLPFDDESTRIDWKYIEKLAAYYLFLPADTDPSALKVVFNADTIRIGEISLSNGDVTDVFAKGSEFTVVCGKNEYPLTVVRSENLPSLFITTKKHPISYINESKDNKDGGTVTVAENGSVTLSGAALKQIKGRGNTTWLYPKKPYNIKFDEKVDLFGMGKAKKWTLLANYLDDSLIRNSVAFDLARYLGLPYTSEYRAVDLYVNGEYLGNYLVCESIEVGKERVNITDLDSLNEEANPDCDLEEAERGGNTDNAVDNSFPGSRKWLEAINSPENISGGYLMEVDFPARYPSELSGFVTDRGMCVVLHCPEYASEKEVNYIADFYQQAEDALYSPDGKNSLGKHYSEYFDMDSLVNMYMLLEYTMCVDAGDSSCYFYKPADEDKIYAGPVWDFDFSMRNQKSSGNIMNASRWFVITKSFLKTDASGSSKVPTVFTQLFRHSDFVAEVREKWPAFSQYIKENISEITKKHMETVRASAYADAILWKTADVKAAETIDEAYTAAAAIVVDYPAVRTAALDKAFGKNAALLYYEENEGNDGVYDPTIYSVGDKAAVSKSASVNSKAPSYVFAGWNTRSDGTGAMYAPGAEIVLSAPVTKLYAIWKEPPKTPDTPVKYTAGDVDGNGKIDAADARLALRASVGLEKYESSAREFLAADVDCSRKVDAADARLILRASVGLENPSTWLKIK